MTYRRTYRSNFSLALGAGIGAGLGVLGAGAYNRQTSKAWDAQTKQNIVFNNDDYKRKVNALNPSDPDYLYELGKVASEAEARMKATQKQLNSEGRRQSYAKQAAIGAGVGLGLAAAYKRFM